jgi:hypothetical protein
VVQVSTPASAAPTEPIAKAPEAVVNENRNKLIDEDSQVGESVLRDILGAEPVDGDK